MKTLNPIRMVLFGVALISVGCRHYATVTEKRPSYKSDTPVGQMIVHAMKRPEPTLEARMGRFIDAAHVAGVALQKNPNDAVALQEYNFAVARLFEVIHESDFQPWKTPVICPGAEGNWTFSMTHDGKPEHNPAFFRILPADRFTFRGKLVGDRSVKAGIGAPMVIASKGFDPTKFDPFIQGKKVYYGVTEVLQFNGRRCTAAFYDPLATETVAFGGRRFPVAADFTAPIGLALAELKPRKTEIASMFNPSEFASSTRLARFQPYDPKKIPILCIHGLGDSQATWAPMIEALRSDATLRQNYQIWFYSYPTGYPYPLMASLLRKKMNEINAYYPGHKPLVVIGHSMGGNISRTLITDSGLKIWNAFFDTPPDKTPLSEQNKRMLEGALIFRHRPDISRVIFMSASLGGSKVATSFIGRLGKRLIGGPSDIQEVGNDLVRLAKPREDGKVLGATPNSIDVLDPNNRFITTINTIRPARGIPYHSIMGDRGKGGNLDQTPPVSTDGIVPYWSAHIDGAQSEVIVPSGHWTNHHPAAIAEVKRILLQHLGRK
jgi:pimeloyl-ACP methyl ester carboxylesterase